MNLLFSDHRGKLFFPIKDNTFTPLDSSSNLPVRFESDARPTSNLHWFKQCTVSCNHKYVFRGIHINPFEKLVTCIKGKILDIIINFDKTASDYLIPQYFTLDPNTDLFQLLVPKNYGHAFLSLEEDSILIYHFSDIFSDTNTKHIHYLDPYICLSLPVECSQLILSDKDKICNFVKPIDYILFGSNGFLGSNLVNVFKSQNISFITSTIRLHEIEKIKHMIHLYSPKYVINCAGITGYPNMFWCDEHKIETIETNITYQLTLAQICKEKNIHLTVFGSGGIFKNDKIYSETDEGNHDTNFYGKCRIYLENIIKNYDNVLYLRINYPICDHASNKNLITKLLSYNTIDSCDISITYINDLFPILIQMIQHNETGICNFTNPGYIRLTSIISIYNKMNNINNTNTSLTENASSIVSKRSFAKLESNILKKYSPLPIEEAIEKCIRNYNIA